MSNLVLLEIPENDSDLLAWLEQLLVRDQVGVLAEQLKVLSSIEIENHEGLKSSAGRLNSRVLSWSNQTRQRVIEQGLSALTHDELRSLLSYPDDLYEVQELILGQLEGHWNELFTASMLERSTASSEPNESTIMPRSSEASWGDTKGYGAKGRGRLIGLIAAMLLISVSVVGYFSFSSRDVIAKDWGWDRPGALNSSQDSREYLLDLAAAAEEWERVDRSNSVALRTRLLELRHGCDTILASPHVLLSEADRGWLLERCLDWRGKVEQELSDLSDGTRPYEDVRQTSDLLVSKLVTALRTRADQAGA